jgi:hypothetical protein
MDEPGPVMYHPGERIASSVSPGYIGERRIAAMAGEATVGKRAHDREQRAMDALENAATLYARYVELARLAEIPALQSDEPGPEHRSWDHPLGLTIRVSR